MQVKVSARADVQKQALAAGAALRTRRGSMYRHILIPTDGSELSRKAIEHGVALARAVDARVTAVTVTVPFAVLAAEPQKISDTSEAYQERMNAVAEQALGEAKQAAEAAGVPCEALHAEHDQPYLSIVETATRRDCDLIVMASHGRRGLAALVLGSETVKVLTHSTIPVLVCR